jgi:hypothetical protein
MIAMYTSQETPTKKVKKGSADEAKEGTKAVASPGMFSWLYSFFSIAGEKVFNIQRLLPGLAERRGVTERGWKGFLNQWFCDCLCAGE